MNCKNYVLPAAIALILVVFYIHFHEVFHFVPCELLGNDASIDWKARQTYCPGMENESNISRFFYAFSPYMLDLTVVAAFAYFGFRKKFVKKYGFLYALPTVAFSDILSNYVFANLNFPLNPSFSPGRNDFVTVALLPDAYGYFAALVLGAVALFYVMHLGQFWRYVKERNIFKYARLIRNSEKRWNFQQL